MVISKKSKCQGCLALAIQGGEYSCYLNFKVSQSKVGGKNVKPLPAENCYKPLNRYQLNKAKKALNL